MLAVLPYHSCPGYHKLHRQISVKWCIFEYACNLQVAFIFIFNYLSYCRVPVAKKLIRLIACKYYCVWFRQGSFLITGKPFKIKYLKELWLGIIRQVFLKLFYWAAFVATSYRIVAAIILHYC